MKTFITDMRKSKLKNINSSYCQDRSFMIYGTGYEALETYDYLKTLKADVKCFLREGAGDETIMDLPVYSIYDLLFEDLSKIYIISSCPEKRFYTDIMPKLMDIGLYLYDDFDNLVTDAKYDIPGKQDYLPDAVLGVGRFDDLPGFRVFGDRKNPDAKIIVTLGGSTSDSSFMQDSWPEYLYKMISRQNEYVVYSGGFCGYPSFIELLKLIRDVIPLNPYAVISLGGYNDLMQITKPGTNRHKRPYLYHGNESLFRNMSEYMLDNDPVVYGLQTNMDPAEYWTRNMRMFGSLASEFSFAFLGVLQPNYFTGKSEVSDQTRRLCISQLPYPSMDYISSSTEVMRQFAQKTPYMADFTEIFDGVSERLYYDAVHVYSTGNRIIASHVMDELSARNLI